MPLQGSNKKDYQREYMKKKREGLTTGSQEVTLLSRPNRLGANGLPEMVTNKYNPTEKIYNNPHYPNGTLRYLGPLSDGQVLDRLTVA